MFDPRVVLALIAAAIAWASQTRLQFTLAGHLFVLPVLVLIAFLIALVLLVLLAWIVRSIIHSEVVPSPSAPA